MHIQHLFPSCYPYSFIYFFYFLDQHFLCVNFCVHIYSFIFESMTDVQAVSCTWFIHGKKLQRSFALFAYMGLKGWNVPAYLDAHWFFQSGSRGHEFRKSPPTNLRVVERTRVRGGDQTSGGTQVRTRTVSFTYIFIGTHKIRPVQPFKL